jgi:hypothetical protein
MCISVFIVSELNFGKQLIKQPASDAKPEVWDKLADAKRLYGKIFRNSYF